MQLLSHVEGHPCPQDIVKQGRNTNRPITGLRNWPYLWPALSIQKMKGCKKNISQKISLLVDRSDAAAGDRKASQAAQNEASYRFPKKIYLVTLCQWGTGVSIRWIEVVWSSFVTSFLFLPVVFGTDISTMIKLHFSLGISLSCITNISLCNWFLVHKNKFQDVKEINEF